MKVFYLLAFLLFPAAAFAFDGSVSIEHNYAHSSWARDYDGKASEINILDAQLNLGQIIAGTRYYLNLEYTFDNTVGPGHKYRDSFIDMRVGREYTTVIKNLKIDTGFGIYGYNNNMNEHNIPYAHIKATYSFGSEEK